MLFVQSFRWVFAPITRHSVFLKRDVVAEFTARAGAGHPGVGRLGEAHCRWELAAPGVEQLYAVRPGLDLVAAVGRNLVRKVTEQCRQDVWRTLRHGGGVKTRASQRWCENQNST